MAYTGSKAKSGRATIVSIGGVSGGNGTTFTPIFELSNASFTGSAWSTVDTTNFNSGADEEFVETTRNNGEVTLEGFSVGTDPGQIALQAAYAAGGKYDFKVQEAPGPGETTGKLSAFSALVTSYEETLNVKNAVTFSSKLKVSGAITVTAGS